MKIITKPQTKVYVFPHSMDCGATFFVYFYFVGWVKIGYC